MKFHNQLLMMTILPTCIAISYPSNAEDLQSAFRNGTVGGNIRAYYNTREYENRPDEAAFSLGGALRAETGPMGWVKLGAGYYTAQDLGTNSDDPAKVNNRLGSNLEVLGEAYISLTNAGHMVTIGRQKIETPFANSGDAFMIPFAFEATTYKLSAGKYWNFEFDYINAIKNRNSEEFIDVGAWSTQRLGAAEIQNTSGTLNLGGSFSREGAKMELWLTRYADLFDSLYARGDYAFSAGKLKPFVGVQYGTQTETGDELLGSVDSTLYGVQAGTGVGPFAVTLAYNAVTEEESSFKRGAFLAPFTFSTSPLFTNNMLETFENVDSGSAEKLTINYAANSQFSVKLSYASFDFDQVVDRDATDFDVIYAFANEWKGLSLRWRVEVVSSDSTAVEQTNMRFQSQFVY